jgi:methionyl-tRNA synthetase
MSKSLGNVINPYNVVKDYETVTGDLSADVLRYYLLRHVNSFEDSDMTLETIKEAYNANLANGLGNLVSRIMTLAEKYIEPITKPEISEFPTEYTTAISAFEFDKALTYVFGRIQVLDKKITETEPFKVVKVDVEKGKTIILELVQELYLVAQLLNPFLPKTNQKIKEVILENKKPSAPLFLRKD